MKQWLAFYSDRDVLGGEPLSVQATTLELARAFAARTIGILEARLTMQEVGDADGIEPAPSEPAFV